MKKICFVNVNTYSIFNSYNNKAAVGGTEIQLFNLANYLSQRKFYQVSFIIGDWGQKEDIEQYNKIKLIKSFSLKKTFWNYIKSLFILWNRIRKVNAEIYIMSSAGLEIGIVSFFCKLNKKKFIYRTAHQMDCDGSFIKNNGFIGRVFEYGLKQADLIITQNYDHYKLLKKQMLNSIIIKNALVINNTYNKKLLKSKINNHNNYILWVARCDKWKRPELFLKIVKSFPYEKFIMISPKVEHNKELFFKIKKEAKNLSNLKFIEKVSFNKIQKYFDRAKLFIGTSDYEGFPNTYIQACIGGTPIISLKVNPDKFITKNNLGYCADGDFKLMLQQIKNILKNKEDWHIKSNKAIEYVKREHDIQIIGKKWEKIINQL